jgi:hypothetical protein
MKTSENILKAYDLKSKSLSFDNRPFTYLGSPETIEEFNERVKTKKHELLNSELKFSKSDHLLTTKTPQNTRINYPSESIEEFNQRNRNNFTLTTSKSNTSRKSSYRPTTPVSKEQSQILYQADDETSNERIEVTNESKEFTAQMPKKFCRSCLLKMNSNAPSTTTAYSKTSSRVHKRQCACALKYPEMFKNLPKNLSNL